MLKILRRTLRASTFLAACFMLMVTMTTASAEPTSETAVEEASAAQGAHSDEGNDGSSDTAVVEDAGSPQQTIETFHLGLIDIMKNAETLGFQGRIDQLSPLMAKTFDLDFMASKTVGRHWRNFSDADKERWAQTFTDITVANYAGRFTAFTGEEFVTTGHEEARRGQQVILTKIVIPKDEDVQLNYRMRMTDAGWRVIDVYLDGTVSELALRRSEYSTALKREGFDELVASIETKIEDLKAKALIDG
jgi:phospholipid transport system substrate-binding protein